MFAVSFHTKVLFCLLGIICKKCFSLLCSSNYASGLGLRKWGERRNERNRIKRNGLMVSHVVGRKFSEWWKLPISLMDGGHGSLSTLENVVSVFALLLTKHRLEQLSFLKNRDQAEAAIDSGQDSASANTWTRSHFHGAFARSVYTVSDDSALLMICLGSL